MTEKLYEGKAKIVFPTDDPGVVLMTFKDDATAFNGKKKATIGGKGALNARISAHLLGLVGRAGVRTHLLEVKDERSHLVQRLEMVPVEVVLRNVVAGSFAERFGREEGTDLPFPVIEFYLKDDSLGDPILNDDHVLAFDLATVEEIAEMRALARKVNDVLRAFFSERGVRLVDFKLEFGRRDGVLVLGDEITPDTCRLWDLKTGEKLDKDRFRRDIGGLDEAYTEVLRRVER